MSSYSATDGTPVWPLFKTVVGSIIQVILVSVAGYVLTLRGSLAKATQRQLNAINVNFFTPCLLFSKVAFSLSAEKFRELWIIPLFFILVSGVSLVVAWFLGFLFRLNPSQRNFAMAAAMIMNSNSLPVALLQTLAVSVPGLEWGQDDTIDSIIGRALSYLLLCGTMGQFIRWSYGVHLLSKAVPSDEIEHTTGLDEEFGSLADGIEGIEDVWRGVGHDGSVLNYSWHNENGRDPYNLHVSTVPQPSDSEPIPVSNPDVNSEHEVVSVPAWSHPPTFLQRVVRAGGKIWTRTTEFMTPPLWASVISIVVALNQPLQHLFNGYLRPVRGAIAQAGDCSVPITLVVLGAYFHIPIDRSALPPSDEAAVSQRTTFLSRLRKIFCLNLESRNGAIRLRSHATLLENRGEGRTIFVTILARMFVVPLLLLPLVVLGALRGSPGVFEDPVFILSMVLLLASPPAVTLGQITQVTSDAFERLIGRTIFWSYCLVAPPVTVGYALIAMLITRL